MESPNSGGHPAEPEPGIDEFAAIEGLRARFEAAARIRLPGGAVPPPGDTWIGDDAAVVRFRTTGRTGRHPRDQVVLATDVVVEGVHVDLALSSLEDVGYKAIMVTVSDFAAMGTRPEYALVSIAAPPGTDLDHLATGLADAAADAGCVIVGGDMATSPVLVVSTTGFGVGSGPDGALLLRSGAQPGDHVFVTGPLGRSAAGLRLLRSSASSGDSAGAACIHAHRRPAARLDEGESARRAGATAAIDLSDGLASDLVHLADASGVGVLVEGLPVAEGATWEEALSGGEDFELVITTGAPDDLMRTFSVAGLRPPLAIGCCTDRPGELLVDGEPLRKGGWHHRF